MVIGEESVAIWNSGTYQNVEVSFHTIVYASYKELNKEENVQ